MLSLVNLCILYKCVHFFIILMLLSQYCALQQVLENRGVRGALMDAVQAAAERAEELGKVNKWRFHTKLWMTGKESSIQQSVVMAVFVASRYMKMDLFTPSIRPQSQSILFKSCFSISSDPSALIHDANLCRCFSRKEVNHGKNNWQYTVYVKIRSHVVSFAIYFVESFYINHDKNNW